MELLEKGGFMMYPILLSSIIALGVIIERFYVIFLQAPLPDQDKVNHVFELSQQGKIKEASVIMNNEENSTITLLSAVLSESDEAHQEKAAILAGNEILFHLRTRLSILSAIGAAAPLMGLLGTVFGMINVFSDVSAMQGGTDPTILASGIWTALLTTAAGMSVAIPCVLTYHYLDRKIKNITHRIEYDGNKLITILNHLSKAKTNRSPVTK
jgi:biopolymer transport protein ExbB